MKLFQMVRVDDMKMITVDQAANILDVPMLAMGQIIFDGKLKNFSGLDFSEAEVLELREQQPEYLQTLR